MARRALVGSALAAVLVLGFGTVDRAAAPTGPIKLARHPDYHAGKIAFSYLGDIWTANEDGTGVAAADRQHARARCIRASRPTAGGSRSRRTATATTTCSSSPRPAARRSRLTYPHRQRRGRRLDARLAAGRVPRVARRRRVPERRDALPDSGRRRAGDSRCPSTGATGARSRPTASRSSSTAIRRSGRASTIAAATRPTCGSPTSRDKTYTTAAGRRAVQPLLADVGRRRHDLLRRRSAAEREGRRSRAASRCARASTTSTRFRRAAASRCR